MPIDNVILTEKRRQYLDGEYTGSRNARNTLRSRLRARSDTALYELIDIAKSEQIDNSEVFNPDTIALLLVSVMNDPAQMDLDQGGLRIAEDDDDIDDEIVNEYSDELREYRRAVVGAVSPVVVSELSRSFEGDSGSSE